MSERLFGLDECVW